MAALARALKAEGRPSSGAQPIPHLFILTPGGFEDLVRATSDPAGSRTLPPADHPMPDEEQMAAAQAAAGCAPVG